MVIANKLEPNRTLSSDFLLMSDDLVSYWIKLFSNVKRMNEILLYAQPS